MSANAITLLGAIGRSAIASVIAGLFCQNDPWLGEFGIYQGCWTGLIRVNKLAKDQKERIYLSPLAFDPMILQEAGREMAILLATRTIEGLATVGHCRTRAMSVTMATSSENNRLPDEFIVNESSVIMLRQELDLNRF